MVEENRATSYRRVSICCIDFYHKEHIRFAHTLLAVLIAECALSLVLEADHLPAFAKRGGVLTPMTAFGDVLIERLRASGRMTIESEVILADADRKRL